MKPPLIAGSAAVCAALLLCACSVNTIALRATADLIDRGRLAIYQESDPKFAREAMPSQLKLLEVLLQNDPKNRELLGLLAEGYEGYSFLFIEEEDNDRALNFHRRALGYALRLAALNPAFTDLASMSTDRLEAALQTAKPGDVPALYWAATAWASQAALAKDDPETLLGLGKAARIMDRLLALDPGYQFGGPDIFYGIYYAALPKMAGGDLDKSKAHFQAALKLSSGNYLMAKLLYARFYAVAAMDQALFRRLNQEVLGARGDKLPAARLANEVAKAKAKRLLEKTNDFF